MRRIDSIILHCSDSEFGDAALIDSWHNARGFDGIGYHYVVLNAYPSAGSVRLHRPEFEYDGVVVPGRSLDIPGAHTAGSNHCSIGICMIGKRCFTMAQYNGLSTLLIKLTERFPQAILLGHYEVIKAGSPMKSCPNIDMDYLRGIIIY